MRFTSGGTLACAGVVFLVLFCATPLEAQFDSGQISGFVRDASGFIVPGVVVTATNDATRLQREAVSNADGYYVFPSLSVGTYTVSAELQGFSRSTTTGVRLNSAARISVNIALEVGALTEGVEVSAAADAMVENAVLGRTVTALQVEQMPLSGRNPVFLARLQAGVVGGRLSGFGGTSLGTGIDSISGGRANDVLVTVDGAIANRTRSTENTMLGATCRHGGGDPGTHQQLFGRVRPRLFRHRPHGHPEWKLAVSRNTELPDAERRAQLQHLVAQRQRRSAIGQSRSMEVEPVRRHARRADYDSGQVQHRPYQVVFLLG